MGDVLEYKVTITQTKAEIADQFWYSQNFTTNGVVLDEQLEISVPSKKYVQVTSPKLKDDYIVDLGS